MKTLMASLMRLFSVIVKIIVVGFLVPLLAVLALRMLSPKLLLVLTQFLQELDTIPVWGSALIFVSGSVLLWFVIGPDLLKQTRKNRGNTDGTSV